MSPIEYIEEGIREGNWETVCEGYERLTDKTVPIPIKSATAEFALRQIADIVSAAFFDPTAKSSKITKKKTGRPKGSRKKKMQTTDDDEDSPILDSNTQLITNDPNPEEIEKNEARSTEARQRKVKLNRNTPGTYDVKCNECDKIFKSDRPDKKYGQKCKKCLMEKKSRFV